MTTKLIIMAPVSAVEAWRLVRVIAKEPAATVVTTGMEVAAVCPDRAQTTTTSPTATVVLVTVKVASAPAAKDVESVVIAPVRVLSVTAVARPEVAPE
jgi:hypothetical protein